MTTLQLEIELDDEVIERLERMADEQDMTIEELCEKVIIDYADSMDDEDLDENIDCCDEEDIEY